MRHERFGQFGILGAIALMAVALTAVQAQRDPSVFVPYLGGLDPVAVMIAVSALGFVSLADLRSRASFQIARRDDVLAGCRFTAVLVPLFTLAAVGADLLFRYPRDMNVPAPDAFAFYPAIAFLVEVCLHAVPLAVLIALFARSGTLSDRRFWVLATPVALLEAGFQTAAAVTAATAAFSGVHLLAFGLAELHVFRRYGFVSMYVFRLAYYVLWHGVWGALRLEWLF